jgi:hypothetical protein
LTGNVGEEGGWRNVFKQNLWYNNNKYILK